MALFWDNPLAEPKRSHRFLVTFDLPGNVPSQIFARTFTKPGYTIGVTEHQFLDKTFYYPGRVTWSDVTMQFVNSSDPDMDAELQAVLLASGYRMPNQVSTNSSVVAADAATINKAGAVRAIGDAVRVSELNGDGIVLGTHILKNPWVTSIAYGTLDYSDEALLTVDIGLRYDWAEYVFGG